LRLPQAQGRPQAGSYRSRWGNMQCHLCDSWHVMVWFDDLGHIRESGLPIACGSMSEPACGRPLRLPQAQGRPQAGSYRSRWGNMQCHLCDSWHVMVWFDDLGYIRESGLPIACGSMSEPACGRPLRLPQAQGRPQAGAYRSRWGNMQCHLCGLWHLMVRLDDLAGTCGGA
jgi:hypothetical protein